MPSKPIFLQSPQDFGTALQRIESLPGDAKNEEWLQELLWQHPELLPVEEFDDVYAPLIPIGREVPTASGPIDNLYVSPLGAITLVETKLWKNPEKHRTVVAQVLDYAKELSNWDYDALDQAVLKASRNRPGEEQVNLAQYVQPALQSAGIADDKFQERVMRSLEQGNFLLLIVGDRISPNVALLTQALHSSPGLGFRLGLAEMQLYTLPPGEEWPLIVVPEIVGRTVEKTRSVVKVIYSQDKPRVEVAAEEPREAVSGSKSEKGPKIDQESFLASIPADQRPVYEAFFSDWAEVGRLSWGTIGVSMRTTLGIGGNERSLIDAYPTIGLKLIRPKDAEREKIAGVPYQEYLSTVRTIPLAQNVLESGRQYVRHEELTAAQLEIILQASLKLAKQINEV